MMRFKKNMAAAFALFLSIATDTASAADATGSIKETFKLRASNIEQLSESVSISSSMGLEQEPVNTPDLPDSCPNTHDVDSDGMCLYNDCHVGSSGDSCFYGPPNGCGPNGVFAIPTYVYDESCCIHDNCYASNRYSQRFCDNAFYDDLINACNELFCWFGNRICLPGHTACVNVAWGMWGSLRALGSFAWQSSQDHNNEYLNSDSCNVSI